MSGGPQRFKIVMYKILWRKPSYRVQWYKKNFKRRIWNIRLESTSIWHYEWAHKKDSNFVYKPPFGHCEKCNSMLRFALSFHHSLPVRNHARRKAIFKKALEETTGWKMGTAWHSYYLLTSTVHYIISPHHSMVIFFLQQTVQNIDVR